MSSRGPDSTASFERLAWTAGIVVGASLPHWFTLPHWVVVLLVLCVLWRLGCAWQGWQRPASWVRIALALGAFGAVLADYRTINGVDAGSALLVVMVALKYLESQTHRDQLVLMIIAYFVVFAGLLYDRSLPMVLYLLCFVLLTTVGLLQLARRGPMLAFSGTLRLASKLLLEALPIMVILFLLFPRLPGPLWGLPGDSESGRSGLSDEMSPGDLTELGLSDEVAFRVEFDDRVPNAEALYWRGPVLSRFDGRTWSHDAGMRRRVMDTLEFAGEPINYRVLLETHGQRWMFALDMPEDWDGPRGMMMTSDYQLIRRGFADSPRARVEYHVTSYPEYHAREPLADADRAFYTRLPPTGNPRTRALVQTWLAVTTKPREIIARALGLFRENQFFYTLTPPALGENAVDDFLFRTREGFCEHYASAFTVMMRMAGIPARVVTGYQGGELNPVGEYYIIRQSNAHAWTEVWLADEGWVRVDPTAAVAPDRISLGAQLAFARQGAGRGWLSGLPFVRGLGLAWDALNTYWQTWVLDYGPQMQRDLLEAFGFERPRWPQLLATAGVLTLLALGGLAFYLGRLYRARGRYDRAARCFERFARKLSRRVGPRRPSEGPVEFGARAAELVPGSAAEIDQIVDSYLKARYEPDRDGSALAALATQVAAFRPTRTPASA